MCVCLDSGMYLPAARRQNDLSSLTMSLRVNERVNWPFDDKQKQAGKTNWKNYDDGGGESPCMVEAGFVVVLCAT